MIDRSLSCFIAGLAVSVWPNIAYAGEFVVPDDTTPQLESRSCGCECIYRNANCDAFKRSLGVEAQKNVGQCQNSKAALEKAANILAGCSYGAGHDFALGSVKALFGLVDGTAIEDILNTITLSKSADCIKNPLAKYAILQPVIHVYKPEMVKIMLDTWTCDNLVRVVKARTNDFEQSIGEKRRKIRKELLDHPGNGLKGDEPEVERRLKGVLTEDESKYLENKQPSVIDHWPCYTPFAKARFICNAAYSAASVFWAANRTLKLPDLPKPTRLPEAGKSPHDTDISSAGLKKGVAGPEYRQLGGMPSAILPDGSNQLFSRSMRGTKVDLEMRNQIQELRDDVLRVSKEGSYHGHSVCLTRNECHGASIYLKKVLKEKLGVDAKIITFEPRTAGVGGFEHSYLVVPDYFGPNSPLVIDPTIKQFMSPNLWRKTHDIFVGSPDELLEFMKTYGVSRSGDTPVETFRHYLMATETGRFDH